MVDKLLLRLFKQNSETAVRRFLLNQLDIEDIPFERDKIGNLFYLGYKKKPLLCAHMDFIKFQNPEIRVYKHYLVGKSMGGDDKAGIYIILKILKELKTNYIFTVGEETGARGIRFFLSNNKLDVPYALVLDRRGAGDILCTKNHYGSKEFEKILVLIGRKYGFSPNRGTFSDANAISKHISCANLSVGYYYPHTPCDIVNIKEMMNSYRFVKECITTIKGKFENDIHTEVEYPRWMRGMDFL